eukprot:13548-Heterococcus_DN1.PRE.2
MAKRPYALMLSPVETARTTFNLAYTNCIDQNPVQYRPLSLYRTMQVVYYCVEQTVLTLYAQQTVPQTAAQLLVLQHVFCYCYHKRVRHPTAVNKMHHTTAIAASMTAYSCRPATSQQHGAQTVAVSSTQRHTGDA